MKKKIIIGVSIVVIAVLAFAIREGVRLSRYKKKAQATTIESLDISQIQDGVYQGEYDLDYVYAAVSVTVKAGKIEQIAIRKHKHGRGAEAEKEIPKRIQDRQSVQVDVVSGATNSSKAIIKAVEVALTTGERL
jgi:uncharacterized protein with FMN-binding domain